MKCGERVVVAHSLGGLFIATHIWYQYDTFEKYLSDFDDDNGMLTNFGPTVREIHVITIKSDIHLPPITDDDDEKFLKRVRVDYIEERITGGESDILR